MSENDTDGNNIIKLYEPLRSDDSHSKGSEIRQICRLRGLHDWHLEKLIGSLMQPVCSLKTTSQIMKAKTEL